MYTIFLNLKKMYDHQLYSNVLPMASVIVTAYNHDRSVLTPEQYFLSLIYYGESLYQERQYRRSEEILTQALHAKKALTKLKTFASNVFETNINADLFPEPDIRYKLALCMEATRQIYPAIEILQGIPNKQRSPKINQLYAKLLQHNGYDKTAIGPLKAVLKECPLNLEAIKGLLALSVPTSDIQSIIGDSNKSGLSPQCHDWLTNYIAAYANMYACKFPEAIEALQSIESKPGIGDNEMILVLIGQCYHYIGNHDTALYYLMRAHNSNNYLTDGMMTLAALFAMKNRLDDLEKLTKPSVTPMEYSAEYWFVLAQHLFCQGRYDKAAFFAQKSCYLKPKNTEAVLLKVKIFMHLKKYKDAIVHLRILQQFASYRFEVYEGLVDAYIATNRIREAHEISKIAVRRQVTNISARAYVLLARPYFCDEDPQQKLKSKSWISRALAQDEYYLPAVVMMVELLLDENDTTTATKLIKKQLAMQPKSKLYSMLGDILKDKDQTKAVENYTIALNMDPTNRKAVAGLVALGVGQSLSDSDAANYSNNGGNGGGSSGGGGGGGVGGSSNSTSGGGGANAVSGAGGGGSGGGGGSANVGDDETNEYQEGTFEIVELPPSMPGDGESENEALWSDVEIEVNTS